MNEELFMERFTISKCQFCPEYCKFSAIPVKISTGYVWN